MIVAAEFKVEFESYIGELLVVALCELVADVIDGEYTVLDIAVVLDTVVEL